MTIFVKNKHTLQIDKFKFKCCVGKKGLTSNKKEGDKKTPKGRAIKIAANAANRAKGTYGNGDGKDVAHKPGKKGSRKAKDVTLQSPSKNRASRLKIRNA